MKTPLTNPACCSQDTVARWTQIEQWVSGGVEQYVRATLRHVVLGCTQCRQGDVAQLLVEKFKMTRPEAAVLMELAVEDYRTSAAGRLELQALHEDRLPPLAHVADGGPTLEFIDAELRDTHDEPERMIEFSAFETVGVGRGPVGLEPMFQQLDEAKRLANAAAAAEYDAAKNARRGYSPRGPVMSLFQLGEFFLHSGAVSSWKLECDALTDEDWKALAEMVRQIVPHFSDVRGVPRGGLKLADALRPFCTPTYRCVLVVDDVLTTGDSMERFSDAVLAEVDPEKKGGIGLTGVVVFARGKCPPWIKPLFQMPEELWLNAKAPVRSEAAGCSHTEKVL
jgi:hypothetical protein